LKAKNDNKSVPSSYGDDGEGWRGVSKMFGMDYWEFFSSKSMAAILNNTDLRWF
jgi:hypothetical protein